MSTSTDPRISNARGVKSPLSGQRIHHPIAIALHRGEEDLALRLADQLDEANPKDQQVLQESIRETFGAMRDDSDATFSSDGSSAGGALHRGLPPKATATLAERAFGPEARILAINLNAADIHAEMCKDGLLAAEGPAELLAAMRSGSEEHSGRYLGAAVAAGSKLDLSPEIQRALRPILPEEVQRVAVCDFVEPETRIACWLSLQSRNYYGDGPCPWDIPCPPYPAEMREKVAEATCRVGQIRPEKEMRLLASISAAMQPEAPAVDQQFVEAAAGLARPGADAGSAWSGIAAQQAAAGDHGSAAFAAARADQAAGRDMPADDLPARTVER